MKTGQCQKLILGGWLFTVISLFWYSFTQIDLGLTLTRVSWWQTIQKSFQSIGYFNRPLSSWLYLGILLSLFVFYFLIIAAVKNRLIGRIKIWKVILITAGILWLSYNAFSYDLFNYIMDARIVTFYGQSPYSYRALDFPGDPMLGFMHWTHRLYPYGPFWLAATIPLSFLGMQKLVPTMILVKGLGLIGYLLSLWSINKILAQKPENRLLGLAVFAFSPLVIIEGLVSGHNDLLMMGIALVAFWFLKEKKYLPACLMLVLSIGMKFVTAALIPIFAWVMWQQVRKREIDWSKVWRTAFILMVGAVLAAIYRDELKPWYLLYPLAFLPFLTQKTFLFWALTGWSVGSLLHYAPFLYLGNWDPPVPTIKFWVTIGFLGLGALIGMAKNLKKMC